MLHTYIHVHILYIYMQCYRPIYRLLQKIIGLPQFLKWKLLGITHGFACSNCCITLKAVQEHFRRVRYHRPSFTKVAYLLACLVFQGTSIGDVSFGRREQSIRRELHRCLLRMMRTMKRRRRKRRVEHWSGSHEISWGPWTSESLPSELTQSAWKTFEILLAIVCIIAVKYERLPRLNYLDYLLTYLLIYLDWRYDYGISTELYVDRCKRYLLYYHDIYDGRQRRPFCIRVAYTGLIGNVCFCWLCFLYI